ncbi:MAG: phosphoglycerate kinase [Actinobacteria bacterium]|nr:phosphoglycerate kinase [Actinomycetota bacterium]
MTSGNRYLTLDDVDVSGLSVLVRSDLNVPLDRGRVADDFRIRAALPTLETLVARGATVTVCSHLGRPKGADSAYSMRPVAERIAELTEVEVRFLAGSTRGITVLENTRFLPGETENDPVTANKLAAGHDLFVEDAFGSVHRAHSSTVGVAEMVRSVAGPLLHAELEALGRFLGEPDQPYVVVLGGAKVSDKIELIQNLLPKVDLMLIGGGMCFTFLRAMGYEVGASLVEEPLLAEVEAMLEVDRDVDKIHVPGDVVVADRFAADAVTRTVDVSSIGSGEMGLDIGPATASRFASMVVDGASVFWNGPMGVFEWEAFRAGTETVARAMGECPGFTCVGGGDTVAAIRLLGLEGTISHLSTGGGAGLELLEGRILPGVAVLERWVT